MSDDQPSELNRRRTRRAGTSDRAEALARLQSLRRRSSGDGPPAKSIQVKIDQPIYDTVDDDEYEAIVAKRREEAKGFIVDDNGLGYGDEGQEEDWTHPTAYSSSEGESNDESERKAKKKKVSNNSEKKDRDASAKKSASLTSAAALMGKQRISNMFTSSVFNKKDNGKNVSYDSIVDDVIAEFAPDESDRERRRRVLCLSNRSNISLNSVLNLPVKIERTSVVGSIGLNGTDDINSHGGGHYEQSNNEGLVEKEENVLTEEKDLCDLIKNETIKENGEEIKEENKECSLKTVDEKDEVTVMEVEKKVFALNAKITEVKDQAFSANLEWQAVKNGGLIVDGDCNRPAPKVDVKTSIGEGSKDFELESDGSLPFYILDAHEEAYGSNSGNLYLFGKVKSGGTYESCCVVVKNMHRCVHAIPTVSLMDDLKVMELEKVLAESRDSVKESQVALRARLHELMSDLKTEITEELLARNVSNFSMAPVKRHYAFERSDIPHGENYVLKINYPFKDSALPSDLKGNKFCALLGTNSSALELFLIKRKIMGPSWLSISRFSRCQAQNVSWCKFEVTVDSPKDIMNSPSSLSTSKIPPVVVAALSLKTVINEKQNSNEIVSASVICCNKAKIDTPMVGSEWTRPGMLSHFTVLRKLEGGIFPMGFTKEAAEKNSCAGSNIICHESSERALLNRLMIELHKLDSDVLVGHNISGFDLDVLLHRAQACKVQSNMWSKIGRLRRSTMPKLNRGSSVFGLGASFGVMSCIAGRLLCDTHICSRDLLKEVSYSLTHLAKTQLNKDRREITPQDIPQMFQSSQSLMELIEYGETDAWLSMELMFHLSVLPLTHQLTKISGNIWQKTLQGARAQRVEYLLLHKFKAKKFILPDKYSSLSKDSKTTKRNINPDYANFDDDPPENDQAKTKKGPSYSGGLVLEPKKGLYDKYVLLLDFNSLYPSIIQEYNICFTTVERPADGSFPRLPSSQKTGVLPELLRSLVERRRKVKSLLKKESGLKGQQLDILQQALKLTANSMYGCLGFSNSRFYAKPLAELITQQGREILQSTVNLVQNTLNLEVIYGDTDSIMIYSGLDDIGKARAIAEKVIQEVNKKYRCLEIDLDGLYKRMLLLKKKKYAAVKLLFRDGTPYEVIERKGLDMVRRDWSLLSKELGDFCLTQILSGGSCEDVVEVIHNKLRKVQEEVRNGQITLEKYVITKTLTKPPEAYPDARNQPHVEVALRLKRNGYVTGCSAGDTVPYVICCEQGNSSTSSSGIAQRARHPDELKTDNANWIIDIDYYLAQQIHPVISRLCASIQGTSPSHLADCLGLDSSKFQNKSADSTSNDPSTSLIFTLDDEERYRGCEPLVLSCPSCSSNFQCSPILNSVCELIDAKQAAQERPELTSNFWQKLRCPKCPDEDGFGRISPAVISNQVKRQADAFIARYYKALMVCDDETCNYTTRSVNLRVLGDSERGTVCPNYPHCNGHLIRKYTEADLYRQLSYFCHTLDTVRCIEKVEGDKRFSLEKELAKIRPLVENASSVVQKIRDRCAYGWVKLNDLIVMV